MRIEQRTPNTVEKPLLLLMGTNTIQQAGGEIERKIIQFIHTLCYVDIVGVGDLFSVSLIRKNARATFLLKSLFK